MNAAADGSATHPPDEGLVRYAHLIYGLHACAVLTGILTSSSIAGRFLFGLPSIVAVILNYARRHEARGTWLESHFEWQIHTFWYALLWIVVTLVVSAPFLLVVVGVFMAIAGFGIVGLWVVYRVARGWLALRERRPMPRHPPVPPAAGA
ncbi:MAG TPA: hypothetical protein VMT49_08690 [Steroidobacteraceae bacterium]|nr:hypothetical protein [Steroidobacteraceae bacterium]